MHWNHRVIKRKDGYYDIREVFYDQHNRVMTMLAEQLAPLGETPAELQEELEMMLAAIKAPILDEGYVDPQAEPWNELGDEEDANITD